MGLSKLKVEYRDKLYYKKYAYKAHMKIPGVYWFIKKAKSVDDYKIHHSRYRYSEKYDPDQVNAVINIMQAIKKNDDFTTRIESCVLILYGNDIDLIKKLCEPVGVPIVYSKIELIENGVLKFKNTPPAEYRVFFNGKSQITDEDKESLRAYIDSNDDITPSIGTTPWLKNAPGWRGYSWCYSSYNLNVNGQQNITYLMLKYSDYLGKVYRLEKAES